MKVEDKELLLRQIDKESIGEISDGYHTFNELYDYRKLYNAAFFNMLAKCMNFQVVKSMRHSDGEECFGGGWFIVMADLPTGQISNHYEMKDWNLFQIPEIDKAPEWDGHTPQEAAKRLEEFLRNDYPTKEEEAAWDDAYQEGMMYKKSIHEDYVKALEFYKNNISYDLKDVENEESEANILTLEEECYLVIHIGYCHVDTDVSNGRLYYKLSDDDAKKYDLKMRFSKQFDMECGYHELIHQTNCIGEDGYKGYLLFPMKDGRYWIVEYEC